MDHRVVKKNNGILRKLLHTKSKITLLFIQEIFDLETEKVYNQ